MGFFSWINEEGESIRNRWTDEGATPVKMLDDTGRSWTDYAYEGYGEFTDRESGETMDYYALVDIMNGGTGDRMRGIELCDPNHHDPAPPHIKTPRLVTPGCTKTWAELEPNKTCPNQGFFNWA